MNDDDGDLHARRMALPGRFDTDGHRRHMPCMDCGDDCWGEYYMIHHWLWREVVGRPRAGYLCVPCLEHRLGRPLHRADFLGCPCNDDTWRKTDRLRERMARTTDL